MNAIRHTDNFRQLAHVLALHECGDFGRAAERLGVTKSALSQSLQRMEDIYGVPLFVRGRRRLSATVYGDILADTARRTHRLFHETQRQMDMLRNLDAGRLEIACDPLLADTLLAPALLKIVEKYPRLEFNQKSGNWSAVQEGFRRGELDMFIGLRPDQPIEGFKLDELELPPLKVYARPGHAIFLKPEPTLDDCWDFPILAAPVPDWYVQRIARGSTREEKSIDELRKFFLVSDSMSLIRDVICASDFDLRGFLRIARPRHFGWAPENSGYHIGRFEPVPPGSYSHPVRSSAASICFEPYGCNQADRDRLPSRILRTQLSNDVRYDCHGSDWRVSTLG